MMPQLKRDALWMRMEAPIRGTKKRAISNLFQKSVTNQPSSSRNDQNLVSPYIIHRSIKHRGFKNGIREMIIKWKWHIFSTISIVERNHMTTTLTRPQPYLGQGKNFLHGPRNSKVLSFPFVITRNDNLLKCPNCCLFHNFISLKWHDQLNAW